MSSERREIASNTNSKSISYKSRWFVVVQFIARPAFAVTCRFRIRTSALHRRIILRRGWVPQPVGRGNLPLRMPVHLILILNLSYNYRRFVVVQFIARPASAVTCRFRIRTSALHRRIILRRGWVPQPVGRGNLPLRMPVHLILILNLSYNHRRFVVVQFIARPASAVTCRFRIRTSALHRRIILRRGWVPQPVGRGNLPLRMPVHLILILNLSYNYRRFVVVQFIARPAFAVTCRFRIRTSALHSRIILRRGWVPQPVGRGNFAPKNAGTSHTNSKSKLQEPLVCSSAIHCTSRIGRNMYILNSYKRAAQPHNPA